MEQSDSTSLQYEGAAKRMGIGSEQEEAKHEVDQLGLLRIWLDRSPTLPAIKLRSLALMMMATAMMTLRTSISMKTLGLWPQLPLLHKKRRLPLKLLVIYHITNSSGRS
jgi:hypothetical protein